MEFVYNVWLVRFELRQMSGFLKTLKKSLENYSLELENAELPTSEEVEVDDEANERFNDWSDEVLSLSDGGDYQRRLYAAFLISWYSFVEDNLIKLCDDLGFFSPQENQEHPKKNIWSAREIIEKKTNYLFNQKVWAELVLINKIRNAIVHDGGRFEISKEPDKKKQNHLFTHIDGNFFVYIEKRLFDYLERHKIWHYYGTFFVRLDSIYCEYLINFATELFEHLFTGLDLSFDVDYIIPA